MSLNVSEQTIIGEHYRNGDKIMLGAIYGLTLYSFILASWFNTWLEAIIIGGSTAAVMTVLYSMWRGTLAMRCTIAVGFMVFSALHIHQAHGMIEAHFGIFVLLAVLLYYRDWRPIVLAAAVIAVHHIGFYYLQTNGGSVFVLANGDSGWLVIIWHAAYVIAETSLLTLMAVNLHKEELSSSEITALTESILHSDQLDLTLRSSGATTLLQRFDGYTEQVELLARSVGLTSKDLHDKGEALSVITQRLSNNAEQQQLETDRIASAVEEMSSAIHEVSNNAQEAAEAALLADQNSEQATAVGQKTQHVIKQMADQIQHAVTTVSQLNEHSKNIASVLDVIRGVAEQTNLLALNAAIEAARAGEQGRGFAVVADEVRTLAQRTQQSTQEIHDMIELLREGSESAVAAIEGSRNYVSDCVSNTNESLQYTQTVLESTQRIKEMNTMIATAANQQSQAVHEISSSISHIAQTASTVREENREAAEYGVQLLTASDDLGKTVSRFKVS